MGYGDWFWLSLLGLEFDLGAVHPYVRRLSFIVSSRPNGMIERGVLGTIVPICFLRSWNLNARERRSCLRLDYLVPGT